MLHIVLLCYIIVYIVMLWWSPPSLRTCDGPPPGTGRLCCHCKYQYQYQYISISISISMSIGISSII